MALNPCHRCATSECPVFHLLLQLPRERVCCFSHKTLSFSWHNSQFPSALISFAAHTRFIPVSALEKSVVLVSQIELLTLPNSPLHYPNFNLQSFAPLPFQLSFHFTLQTTRSSPHHQHPAINTISRSPCALPQSFLFCQLSRLSAHKPASSAMPWS